MFVNGLVPSYESILQLIISDLAQLKSLNVNNAFMSTVTDYYVFCVSTPLVGKVLDP